ncbi:MAG: triose-phosphate isomerase [Gammaproteobacteria bacterium]|nr:triose-phosphate isomerase [Gammaproteobacteria bacterium]
MAQRQYLVAGNWKLNGSRESASSLASAVVGGVADLSCQVAICPVALHLPEVSTLVTESAVMLGAQNCSSEGNGAFTGEVSASMLAEFGCEFVIVGHSERRQLFGETSQLVAEKVVAVLDAGMVPIVCIGETLEERESGQLEQVLNEQLDAVLDRAGIGVFSQSVIAYEPVWAIGTGKTASPEQAQDVHDKIRKKLARADQSVAAATRILYGGSVKPDNAESLFSQPDIDGGLIGGAALDADSFLSICQAAA